MNEGYPVLDIAIPVGFPGMADDAAALPAPALFLFLGG